MQLRWGKCKPYLFMDSRTPMITIGPNVKRFIMAYIFYAIYGSILLRLLYQRNIGLLRFLFSVTTYLSALTNYLLASIINQGIQNYGKLGEYVNLCSKCNLYQTLDTGHCNDCEVCVEELDHHCPWIGKCVGKHNKQYFQAFILSIFTFQISSLLFFIGIL